jgi:large subunit ribosomal protein L9
MKVILREDIQGVGAMGELVDVAEGFARNYLLPKNMALQASVKNQRLLEHQQRLAEKHKAKVKVTAAELAQKLEAVSCTIPVLVGEQDKLYGSVTAKDIEDALAQEGLRIPKRQILLGEPIKALGVYTVDVRLHADVTGKLKVWVVAK